MKTIKVLVALLVTVFLLPNISSGNPDPKLIEGAKKEGRMAYWTTMTLSQSKQVVDAFHKKYPFIKPDLYRTGGDALINKVLTERRMGRHAWDVVAQKRFGAFGRPLPPVGLGFSPRGDCRYGCRRQSVSGARGP